MNTLDKPDKQPPGKKHTLASFFREASEQEKTALLERVMRRAMADQRAIIEKAQLLNAQTPAEAQSVAEAQPPTET